MPALLAYLIALALLLGGGYGALSWLAAPEPVKITATHSAKLTPPSPSHYEAGSEPSSPQPDAPIIAESTALGAPSPQSSPQSEASSEQSARSAKAEPVQQPIQDQKGGSAKAGPEQTAQAPAPIPSGNSQSVTPAGPLKVSRPGTRPYGKLASSHPRKPALVLMTLRTIEFPDGRRLTQLIPYRGAGHVMAFEADE